MGYVVTFNYGHTEEWHVQDKCPVAYNDVQFVRELQADGHEAEKIKEIFGESIPMPNTYVKRWIGDFAKTIVANLP